MRRIDARGIGADAEERRVAQRDDARIAEHQVERQREQDHDQDLAAERQIVGEGEVGRDSDDPRQQFDRAQAVASDQRIDRRRLRRDRTGRRGRHSSRPIIAANTKNAPSSGTRYLHAGVAEAQQQRRDERAAQRAEAADRDDHQEIDEIFGGVAGIDRQDVGAEAAAECGQAGAQCEGQREQAAGVDADRFRHAAIVHRGAKLRAEVGALDAQP